MRARLQPLDTILKIMCVLDKEQFTEQYPGYYLLAMGFLSAEEIVARKSLGRLASDEQVVDTLPMKFGEHPKHDPHQPHPLAGQTFRIGAVASEGVLTLGRGAACDIVVPDASVSEEHCRLQLVPEGIVVADLGSTNGTSINLERLDPDAREVLADGDILTVGRYSFQLLRAPTLYSTLSLIRALDTP